MSLSQRLRKPTGLSPWPVLLFEGEEGAGKTYAALQVSSSPHVGPTYAFDLGEGSLDEYAPLGPFQIVDHDGTYRDFLAALRDVMAEPVDPQKPSVIVIDTVSALWSLLVDEAQEQARRSPAGQRSLQRNPDAEVTVTMDKWNVAKRKWRAVLDPLMAYSGIVILTARGKTVAAVENGQPVAGKSEWKVEAEKSLAFDANVWVRFTRPRKAEIIKARSLRLQVPSDRSLVVPGFTAHKLVFEMLGLAPEQAQTRALTVPTVETEPEPPQQRRQTAQHDVDPEWAQVRGEILEQGQQDGMDPAALAQEYASINDGAKLREATTAQLREFLT